MPGDLGHLLDQLLAEELDEHPVAATRLGADGYDDRLDDVSADGFARRTASMRRQVAEFEAVDTTALTAAEKLDRDLVVASLRGRLVMADWAEWQRNPDVYLNPGLDGVFQLFLDRARPDRELAASAAARLRAVPELLEHGRRNLQAELVSPLLAARAQDQCRAAIRYARELVAGEVSEQDGRADLAAAGEQAAAAYESFLAYLEELTAKAAGTHVFGEARYTAVLQQRELLDMDTAALHRLGEEQYELLSDEMAELCRTSGLAADGDWHRAVQAAADDHPGSPDEMRDAYDNWTRLARAFLQDMALVSFPDGEQCEVVPSPHFQRPVLAVASYSLPPPFRASLVGHFFVPYPPDGTPPEEVDRRLQANGHNEIPTVSVHEAYPGHHWHLVTMRASGRPIRHLYRSTYFTEGWALYAERMMREQGFFADPRHELMHLKDRIFRAARIVVDTSIHTGQMTPEEATRFMIERAGLPEPTAWAEVRRYCAWPTQASAYLTGSLAIERVRDRWFADARGDLRAFHDGIASLGAMPVPLHERGLFDGD